MDAEFWYACEQPERPPDPYVLWHYDDPRTGPCAGCAFKAHVQSMRFPESTHVEWLVGAVGAPS